MLNRLINPIVKPSLPRAAIGFRREGISVVGLQKQGGAFTLSRAATVELPENALQPSFNEQNLVELHEILLTLNQVMTAAGLQEQKRWSVSLPADTARMSILTLDAPAKSNNELKEVLNWKAERAFGAAANEMRMAFQPLTPDVSKRIRYFVVSIRLEVLAEYENLFGIFDWHVGLVMPRHISEAQWLMAANHEQTNQDTLMVSLQAEGFTAILLRGQQPSVVRSVSCNEDEREDELYRLLLFYRDRIASVNPDAILQKLLLVGDNFQKDRLREIAFETLGNDIRILESNDVGLVLPNEIRFQDVAGPAGLASLAWR